MKKSEPYLSWHHNGSSPASELAVFVPGLGDKTDGPIGRALREQLSTRGIAFLGVESSDPVPGKRDVRIAVPPSEQTERVLDALQTYEQSAGVKHIIGHSQGGWAVAEATLLAADDGYNRGGGRTLTIATPHSPATQRLGMIKDESIPRIPEISPLGIVRSIRVAEATVLLSTTYLREVDRDPKSYMTEVYRSHASGVVLAERDQVLGGTQSTIQQELAAIDESRVTAIQGADHEFSTRRHGLSIAVLGYLANGNFTS